MINDFFSIHVFGFKWKLDEENINQTIMEYKEISFKNILSFINKRESECILLFNAISCHDKGDLDSI